MPRFAVRTTLPASEADVGRQLVDIARLATVGCRLVRVRVPWASFVPQPGRIDRSIRERLVALVTGIRAVGLDPHVSLCGRRVPGWFIDDLAFSDERCADRHWSFFVDEVIASIDGDIGGVIPFETPLLAVHGLYAASLATDNHDLRRFVSAVDCVTLLVRRTATLCGSIAVTCVIDRAALFEMGGTRGLSALPDEAAHRFIDMVRGSDGRFVVGVDVSAHPRLTASTAPGYWTDTIVNETARIAESLTACSFSLIGIPDREEPDAVAEFTDEAIRAVTEISDIGINVETVWLGDHARMPTEAFAATNGATPTSVDS